MGTFPACPAASPGSAASPEASASSCWRLQVRSDAHLGKQRAPPHLFRCTTSGWASARKTRVRQTAGHLPHHTGTQPACSHIKREKIYRARREERKSKWSCERLPGTSEGVESKRRAVKGKKGKRRGESKAGQPRRCWGPLPAGRRERPGSVGAGTGCVQPPPLLQLAASCPLVLGAGP